MKTTPNSMPPYTTNSNDDYDGMWPCRVLSLTHSLSNACVYKKVSYVWVTNCITYLKSKACALRNEFKMKDTCTNRRFCELFNVHIIKVWSRINALEAHDIVACVGESWSHGENLDVSNWCCKKITAIYAKEKIKRLDNYDDWCHMIKVWMTRSFF